MVRKGLGLPGRGVIPPMPIEDVYSVTYYREKKEAEVFSRGRTVFLTDVYNIHAFSPNEVWTWDRRTEYKYPPFNGKVVGVLFGTMVIERMG